jgi:hypothetical protein
VPVPDQLATELVTPDLPAGVGAIYHGLSLARQSRRRQPVAGSIGIVAAVPITTVIATLLFVRPNSRPA